ncbi:Uncharacterized protein FWK35_00010858 [Aphis craccivora]|uniref:Pre-C2HC domain-containing protein n=1 Tax=Aphis craccivora TaxID=307492 RepID=A0A6G0YRB9_APHCR|nr:Uncharacterized protein FWK35_00010858 [Aphis craccivora]
MNNQVNWLSVAAATVLPKIAIFQILQKKKKNTRTSSAALTPPYTSKNIFAPLLTFQVNDNTDGTADEVSTQESQNRNKALRRFRYRIPHLPVPENKQLSVIIRNLPVNISEASIYKELVELKFEVASVTRLQNKFKTPIPIVAVLLSKSSTEIYSLNRLLHCVVAVEPRQPSNDIPQCTNCQRFSHTKKFCHLPPRCVKCAGDHHYSSCPKEIETPPKCVNCLSNHPASYRGCTF